MFRSLSVLTMVGLLASWSQLSYALDYKQIREELKKHPSVSWTAKDLGTAEMLGIDRRANPFGLIESTDQYIDIISDQSDISTGLPEKFDWRNVDGKNWVTPIRNQAACGSCVAFGTLGVVESKLNIISRVSDFGLDLSEQFLFSNIGSCDQGAMLDDGASSMSHSGSTDEACAPYTMGRTGSDAFEVPVCQNSDQRLTKITGYRYVSGSRMKEAVRRGPVITRMSVYEDFMYYSGGVYEHLKGPLKGGHAVTLIGYDDNDKAWIVKNSWGEQWGEAGYFRIKYSDESGVGKMGYELDVPAPGQFVSVSKPTYRDAVSGDLDLIVKKLTDKDLSSVSYLVISKNQSEIKLEGEIDPIALSRSISTKDLEDGEYELALSAKNANGDLSQPWYSSFYVVNHKPSIDLKLGADDFDPANPVSDRVYLSLDVSLSNVPLTDATLIFKKTDGSFEKTTYVQDPGAKSKVGWRTAMFPDGEYEVRAIGRVGDLYTFESNSLIVTVKN